MAGGYRLQAHSEAADPYSLRCSTTRPLPESPGRRESCGKRVGIRWADREISAKARSQVAFHVVLTAKCHQFAVV